MMTTEIYIDNYVMEVTVTGEDSVEVDITTSDKGDPGAAVQLRNNGTSLQWNHEGDEQWSDLALLSDLKGNDGVPIVLQKTDTYVQWKYVGSDTWINLVAIADLTVPGEDGREIELQNAGGYIQWRYVGTANWTNIVALASLKGDTGPAIMMRNTGTVIQWAVVGTTEWNDLITIASLTPNIDSKQDKEEGKGLSQENYTTTEKQKLAGLESSHYKGRFTNKAALDAAFPTASAGDYTRVDAGVGEDVVTFIWDDSDNEWVQEKGTGTTETAASIKTKYEENPDTNCFTDAEKSKLANQSGNNTGDQDLSGLQPKETGKGLSTNDFTDAIKNRLANTSGNNTGDQTKLDPRVLIITTHPAPEVNTDLYDAVSITALIEGITSMSSNLTGTPVNFQKLIYRISANGAYNLVWGTKFASRGAILPVLTVSGKLLTVGLIYNSVTITWDCVAVSQEV